MMYCQNLPPSGYTTIEVMKTTYGVNWDNLTIASTVYGNFICFDFVHDACMILILYNM